MKAKMYFAVMAVLTVVGGRASFAQTNSPSAAGGTTALPGGTASPSPAGGTSALPGGTAALPGGTVALPGGTVALPGGTAALPGAFQQATNQSGSLAVFNAALSLLPAWNPALTNSFESGEFTLESAPLWKSMSAAATTPYNSTEADYFFTRNLGLGAEMISLGNGSGNDTIDTLNLSLTLRKDIGNIAGYLLLDGGYGFNQHRAEGAFGPGIIYQYQTHLRLFLDTRFELGGTQSSQEGFLTRIGMQIPF